MLVPIRMLVLGAGCPGVLPVARGDLCTQKAGEGGE